MPYTTLISVKQLVALIEHPQTVVVDCQFELGDPPAGEIAYAAGHLTGAVYAHLDRDLSSPVTATSGRHPLPDARELADKFAAWGIDRDKQIVAYDNSGGAFAARLWWLARWLGLERVAVLDGGLAAWQAAGNPLTADVPQPTPTNFIATPHREMWLDSAEVQAELEAGHLVLIDAREAERFAGRTEPIDPVAGHVPGALNLPFKENWDSDGKFLSAAELAQRFAPQLGERPTSSVAHMCGSGVTACVNLLACEHAGIKGTRLYAGSWSEWIRCSDEVATE